MKSSKPVIERPPALPGSELLWVCGVLGVFLLVHLLTGDRWPIVWTDEVIYNDPGINLYLGHGLTSSVWHIQGSDEMWAGNVPLYPALLAPWLKAFGLSILAVRSLNFVLLAVSALLVWIAVRRLNWIPCDRHRLVMLCVFLSAFSLTYCCRSGRYDVLCLALAAAALAAYSLQSRARRLGLLVALGVLFPWAGLHLVVYAAILAGLLFVFFGRAVFVEALCVGLGCLLGGGLLFAFYIHYGVWDDFLAATLQTNTTLVDQRIFREQLGIPYYAGGVIKALSLNILLVLVLVLVCRSYLQGRFAWRSPLVFAIAVSVVVPAVIIGLSAYHVFYAWTVLAPVTIALFSALAADGGEPQSRVFRLTKRALVTSACLVGLPAVLVVSFLGWRDRDFDRVEQLIAEHVDRDDWVWCHPSAYYAVKTRAARVFSAFVLLNPDKAPPRLAQRHGNVLTPEQRSRLSVVVTPPGGGEPDMIGGEWKRVGAMLRSSWPGFPELLVFATYELQVYRRIARPAEPDHAPAVVRQTKSSASVAR